MAQEKAELTEMERDIADAWITRKQTGITQKDLADRWQISVRTVQRILRRPHVMQYIRNRVLAVSTLSFDEVMQTLTKRAIEGRSIKAIELYLDIIGILKKEKGEEKEHGL